MKRKIKKTKQYNGKKYNLVVSSKEAPDGVWKKSTAKKVADNIRLTGGMVRTEKVGKSGNVRLYFNYRNAKRNKK